MYSSRGSNAYGQQQQQQQYSAQSAYGQNLGSAYPGSAAGGPEAASQQSLASRHASMLAGGAKEADLSGYRGHATAGTHYGGQYSSVYGSGGLTSGQPVPSSGSKAAGPSALEGRPGYGSAVQQSPKFKSGEYAYGQKSEQLLSDKISDYASAADRRQYSERLNSYMGRDLQSETASRYADPIAYSHQQKGDIYDRLDQASLLQRESLLKSQSLQSAALDGGSRQADYLAAMGSSLRHPPQELLSYGGRVEAADPRTLSMLSGGSSLHTQAPSILGAAPRRNVEELVYAAQASSNSGYGVSLPPGRDYATGKGLHGSSLDPDYPVGLLPRGGHPRLDDRKDDRGGYARELERREEERRREHLREREKERERERERERDRERERERERKRERERREERDRELKVARRERTPIRISRDRRGSSATKEGSRPLRRESPPRREATHRRRSPVKEIRREYICKVYSSSLVDAERGYLSIDKRYPRLFISPEFTKVVVHWPKEDVKLSIHTPVSFEHDFVEEETCSPLKEQSIKPIEGEAENLKQTVWNAKLILMSGLSHNAIEELSSERNYEDRIPHYCNMLRFALLKKDKSFMAIGGPWDTIDGGDPSVDDSSLVQTATRYAKDVTGLDLSNCHKWNRFLEIHYDRLGKDGLFSHKEVTVLYVPDLSGCLTSLDAWREQWLSHKKAVAERERQLALKKEKSREKKEVQKDEEPGSAKDVKKDSKMGKGKETATEKAGDENGKKAEKTDEVEAGGATSSEKKEQTETPAAKKPIKQVKKKIVKKIVKKVVDKKDGDKSEKKEDNPVPDVTVPQEEAPSSTPAAVKTFARKKVTKKSPVVKVAAQKKKVAVQAEVKSTPEGDQKEKPDSAVKDASTVKTTVKKKVIKRVPKRKVSAAAEAAEGVSTDTATIEKKEDDAKVVTNAAAAVADADIAVSEVKSDTKTVPKKKAKTTPAKKGSNPGSTSKTLKKNENEEKSKVETPEGDKKKVVKKDDDNKKEKSKDTDRSKADKEKEKEKKKAEEPPRHPGLILQTKGTSDSKIRSLSLSLDSLMDYSDKDLAESTFELSLFAETLYEMLQYQMGCRLLTFLQKLRIKFVTKRNQRKRQREEKENEKKSSPKRPKTEEVTGETKSVKSEKEDEIKKEDEMKIDGIKKEDESKMEEDKNVSSVKEEKKTSANDEVAATVKTEEETDEEDEDPEEDPEEEEEDEEDNDNDDEEMEDPVEEENVDGRESEVDEKKSEDKTEKADENDKETADAKPKADSGDSKKEVAAAKAEKVKSKKEAPVADKELLQAFRFFDRNRVGFVRVEDLRLIIHNLGKFMSHRDVKELVQSALLESSTGRDDRILYTKLVRMTDV